MCLIPFDFVTKDTGGVLQGLGTSKYEVVEVGVCNAELVVLELVVNRATQVKTGKSIEFHALDILFLKIMAGCLESIERV